MTRTTIDSAVGIVEHNTGHKQPASIDLKHIMVHATHANIDRDDVVRNRDF